RWTASSLQVEALEDRVVPSFVAPISSYPTGINPQVVVAADFTGDGKADLATLNAGDSTVSVLRNLGDGSFDTASITVAATSASYLAVGDFNRDGKVDLVTVNPGGGDINVLLGNGDGTFGTPTSFLLPGQFPPDYTDPTPLPQTPYGVAVGDL